MSNIVEFPRKHRAQNPLAFMLKVSRDGDRICLLIGLDLKSGVCGLGSDFSEALRDLADDIASETDPYPVREREQLKRELATLLPPPGDAS